jgi:hypothetical protein
MSQQSTEELSNQIAGTRRDLATDLDALQDRVSPQAIMDRRKAAVRGRFASAKDKVMGGTSSFTSASPGQQVRDQAGSAAHGVEDRVQGSPLGAGLVAFGFGLVVAGLVPSTRAEQSVAEKTADLAKEHGQPLKEHATQAAREVGDQLKEAGSQAADDLKSTAQQSASRVQDEAPIGGQGSGSTT